MKSSNKSTLWVVAVILGIFALLVVLAKTSKNTASGDATTVAADDWVRGNKDASVTLMEYSDFQCPACGAYYPIVKQLEEKYGNQIRIVYRHFPLTTIHQYAPIAARAAEAAGLQSKFWEMHDILFEKQKEWSDSDPTEKFVEYARSLGLDVNRFRLDLDNQAVRDAVAADVARAQSLGLNSTPSFLLQGKRLQPNPGSFDEFKTLIDATLKNAPITISPAEAEQTSSTLAAAPNTHEHFDFALHVNGAKIDFTQAKYQEKEKPDAPVGINNPYVHFEDGEGSVAHLHKKTVQLGYFLQSLNMKLTNDCLTTDDGKELCGDDKNSLKVFVNGRRQVPFVNYEMKDLDRVLVSFGPLTDATEKQLGTLTDRACIFYDKCPERGKAPKEKCVGGLGTDCVQ